MSESLSSSTSSSFVVSAAVADDYFNGDLSTTDIILKRARERAPASRAGYAGNVTPQEAWELVRAHAGVLVDVRTAEERLFVGRVVESVHVPWATGLNLQRNPRFVREVEGKVRRDDVLLLICRSGGRSAAAAAALTEARFRNAFSVLEGFEGTLDAAMQRGSQDGWRHHRLPWIQD
jgi:rhodanese-related sulfurtransferase